ncbi:MAG: outer membrane lipoprotein LolB [Pseudomonadales bacterium]|nr:outer membrane lipoprotein LolB [Pseudomonadales bacterium]
MKPLNVSTFLYKLISRFRPSSYAFFFSCIFLLLSGCSQTPIQETLEQPDWKISGKIGFRQSLLKGGTASFNWTQKDQHYIIHLFNPLGRPELSIKGNDKQAFAVQADGTSYYAQDPEQLMQRITGWSFPMNAVKQWMQGKTLGDERNRQYNQEQQLQSFDTPIWHVELSKYKAVGDQLFPHRLRLEKNDLRLTIIIKQHHANFL